jgi:hypothetical protein
MKYVEVTIGTKDFEEATPVGLGLMLQSIYTEYKGAPILLQVSDEIVNGPWVTNDPKNYNRIDYEGNT